MTGHLALLASRTRRDLPEGTPPAPAGPPRSRLRWPAGVVKGAAGTPTPHYPRPVLHLLAPALAGNLLSFAPAAPTELQACSLYYTDVVATSTGILVDMECPGRPEDLWFSRETTPGDILTQFRAAWRLVDSKSTSEAFSLPTSRGALPGWILKGPGGTYGYIASAKGPDGLVDTVGCHHTAVAADREGWCQRAMGVLMESSAFARGRAAWPR